MTLKEESQGSRNRIREKNRKKTIWQGEPSVVGVREDGSGSGVGCGGESTQIVSQSIRLRLSTFQPASQAPVFCSRDNHKTTGADSLRNLWTKSPLLLLLSWFPPCHGSMEMQEFMAGSRWRFLSAQSEVRHLTSIFFSLARDTRYSSSYSFPRMFPIQTMYKQSLKDTNGSVSQ